MRNPGRAGLAIWLSLFPYLKPYKLKAFLALMALTVAAIAILAGGRELRTMIDQGFGTSDPTALHRSILILFTGSAVLAAGSALRYYLVTWLGERVAADMRHTLMARLINLDAVYYETAQTGAAISAVTADTAIVQSVVGSSVSVILRNLLLMVGSIILLFLTSTKLTLLIFLIIPIVVLPILFFGRKVRSLSRATQEQLAAASARLSETLYGIRIVQAFVRERQEQAAFDYQNEAVFHHAVNRMQARAWLTFSIILLIMTGICAVLWTGSRDVVLGTISDGQFVAFVYYAIVAAASFGALGEQIAELQRAAGAMERILALAALKPHILPPATPMALPKPVRGKVQFNHVTFHYPSQPTVSALHDVCLDIEPGERIALVGPSGAGKTTFFHLLLRFYDPQAGTISLDGIELRNLDLNELRRSISIVPQEPMLFSQSVEENIRFGRPEASRDQIRLAAKQAHAIDFIEKLPEQFDTKLGEKGMLLSGGQRQRIAIARAILRDPALLLLDEATSALDAESELAVQQALDEIMRNRTTIVIAHRLATILKADRIVVLDQGRIQAIGRHEELTAQGGLYTRLAQLQFGMIP